MGRRSCHEIQLVPEGLQTPVPTSRRSWPSPWGIQCPPETSSSVLSKRRRKALNDVTQGGAVTCPGVLAHGPAARRPLDQRALLGPRFTFISETFLSVSVCVWSVMSHSDFLGY